MAYGRKTKRTYRKTNVSKVKRNQKNGASNKKTDTAQTNAIVTLDKRVKKLEKLPELKYYDEWSDGSVVSLSGNPTNPVAPHLAQGIGVTQRIGNKIYVTGWNIKCHFLTAPLCVNPTTIRMIIFYDNQFVDSPVTPYGSPESLLYNIDSVAPVPNLITDPTIMQYNPNTRKRYKILYDKKFVLDPYVVRVSNIVTATTTTSQVISRQKNVNVYIPIRKTIQYISNNSSNSDVMGSVPLMWLFSNQSSGGNPPIVQFSGRLSYYDC